jgi:predicted HNH restriction endonuclease
VRNNQNVIIPVGLESAGVMIKPRSTKGWSIETEDVESILNFNDRLDVPTDYDLDFTQSREGRRRFLVHLRLERNKDTVLRAKAAWLSSDPDLKCCCCRMSFRGRYGERGAKFIEAHHIKPLGQLKHGEVAHTTIADLVPVCANCHRMLHRPPQLSIDALIECLAIAETRFNNPTAPMAR